MSHIVWKVICVGCSYFPAIKAKISSLLPWFIFLAVTHALHMRKTGVCVVVCGCARNSTSAKLLILLQPLALGYKQWHLCWTGSGYAAVCWSLHSVCLDMSLWSVCLAFTLRCQPALSHILLFFFLFCFFPSSCWTNINVQTLGQLRGLNIVFPSL